jgi:hypothetical protein
MVKKIVALVFVISIIGGIAAGCSGGDTGAAPADTKSASGATTGAAPATTTTTG